MEENGRNVKDYVPVSKKENQAWNFISQTNAEIVAGNMVNNSDVQSYLIDSHAWNTICRLIEKKYNSSNNVLDSTKWGNYYNNKTTKYDKLNGLWAKHLYNDDGWTYATSYNTGLIPSGIAPQDQGQNRLELATGISEDFKVYNIYDLAGNMWEWTTETGQNSGSDKPDDKANCNEGECTTKTHAVQRGGSSYDVGNGAPVVCAMGSYGVDLGDGVTGFRVVLYLK